MNNMFRGDVDFFNFMTISKKYLSHKKNILKKNQVFINFSIVFQVVSINTLIFVIKLVYHALTSFIFQEVS